MEINRIKKILEQRDNENMHLTTQLNIKTEQCDDAEEELELKNAENNKLRKQVVDFEATMQDLYVSRKGNGTQQIELDSLKADNERLLELLKGTSEYADMDDSSITAKANSTKTKAKGKEDKKLNKSASGATGNKQKINNDWIPTEAVRSLLALQERYKGQLNETCVSQILYQLNTIWRNIMRKENDAIKKRLNAQI